MQPLPHNFRKGRETVLRALRRMVPPSVCDTGREPVVYAVSAAAARPASAAATRAGRTFPSIVLAAGARRLTARRLAA